MNKVLLLDIDGVLLKPEDVFSRIYAKQHRLDSSKFPDFFKGDFQQALVGKVDLRTLITKHNNIWHWNKDVDELLKIWFETETIPNSNLLKYIDGLRNDNLVICIATNQEKLRGEYLEKTVFLGRFDEYYISANMGVLKPQPEFFEYIIQDLRSKHGNIHASDILYFDDTKEHVESAKRLGINSHLYKSDELLIQELKFFQS